MDAGNDGGRLRGVHVPRRVFPELLTEETGPGEKQVYARLATWPSSGAGPGRWSRRAKWYREVERRRTAD